MAMTSEFLKRMIPEKMSDRKLKKSLPCKKIRIGIWNRENFLRIFAKSPGWHIDSVFLSPMGFQN
jgi:hypothetical protein